jgi:hypothetical protein
MSNSIGELYVVYVDGEEKGYYTMLDAVRMGEWFRVNDPVKTVEIIETETSDY